MQPDKEIILASQKGDRIAQNKLYKYCHATLIGLCWRYSGDSALAIEYLNNGFVKIVMGLNKYREDIPFELWSRKIMVNSIIDDYRKSKTYQSKFVVTEPGKLVSDEDLFIDGFAEDLLELVKAKIVLLPPTTCKVVNLYAFDGYKHKEIAAMLRISESTSMWHYSEGIRRIKEMIGKSNLSQAI